MAITRIDQYEVMYSANTFPPRIWLQNGGQFIGQLIFQKDGSVLPPDTMAGTQVNLYYHVGDFENVIELLRRIKPMYLVFNGSGAGFENGIMTSPEPIGT